MQEHSRGVHDSLNSRLWWLRYCAPHTTMDGLTDELDTFPTWFHHEAKLQHQPQKSLCTVLTVIGHFEMYCLFPKCLCTNANKSNMYVYHTILTIKTNLCIQVKVWTNTAEGVKRQCCCLMIVCKSISFFKYYALYRPLQTNGLIQLQGREQGGYISSVRAKPKQTHSYTGMKSYVIHRIRKWIY